MRPAAGLSSIRRGTDLLAHASKGWAAVKSRKEREMDRMDTMFEVDPVAPHLYLDSFKRTRILEPEKELMLAILTDAVECLHKHSGSRQPTGMKLFREAKEWIFDEDQKGAFSFLNVCDALDLDPCYIRRGIVNLNFGLGSEATKNSRAPQVRPTRSKRTAKPRVKSLRVRDHRALPARRTI
jgi:hypothetical protein